MENQLQVFNNAEFGQVRTIVKNEEVWFVGKDVAEALGYSNTRDALTKHIDNEDRADVAIHDGRQNRSMIIINESGLYSLVFSSKLPSAKKFKHWVTSEVLPLIRKTGSYSMKQQPVDDTKKLRSEAMLLNARTRQAKMWKELSQMTTIKEYKEIAFAKAGNVLAGKEIFSLPEATEKTYSADEIGAILGVSANKIGRLANAHNLKTEQYGKLFYDKSKYSNKEIETFRYFECAIEEFKRLLTN
ncbi:MAG: Bro-N domain-containing protein [Megamonas funiformis]|jgi:prophage antirepressor-like protein|uniref:BRO-N domain-containing protein n=2 Tax=Megamonas TaxID=158846 RepID=UPI001EBF5E79|nr:Bro-N domain-containing protein [Megamonas funiformis]MBS7213335.1 Bro-N domain-containing protein [Megamonas funiformis]